MESMGIRSLHPEIITIESSLEKGQNGDSHLLNHTMNDCCFYLKYIDISKDGTHAVLSRNLDER